MSEGLERMMRGRDGERMIVWCWDFVGEKRERRRSALI